MSSDSKKILLPVFRSIETTLQITPPPYSVVIAEKITSFPDNLSVEDVEDFVSLAKYYGERTPASFRYRFRLDDVWGKIPKPAPKSRIDLAFLALPPPIK